MNVIRIGEKVIDRKKITSVIDKLLELRAQGLSQKETASRIGLERTFISRVEKIGEIRKGRKIAVLGFPIANKEELQELLNKKGIEFSMIMSDEERWDFVSNKNGIELFNTVTDIITKIHTYDTVIVIGSNYRIRVSEALLDKEVIGVEIGKSPIENDKNVDIKKVEEILDKLIE
jgi:transcriptional regulator with XRE-family HTH domain